MTVVTAASVAIDLGIFQWAVYAAKGRIVRRLNEEFADLVVD